MEGQKIPSYENLLSRAEIMERILSAWKPTRETEEIAVEAALGRIPDQAVCARVTLPVVRASAGDGVAVKSALFAAGPPDTSDWVLGRDFVRADTGDDFDDAFDAVIMIEDVDLSADGKLTIHKDVRVEAGARVRPRGSTVKEGELLVAARLPLRARDLGLLQTGGVNSVRVLKRPVVAYIPSGSELIAPGTPLSRGKIYDTNSLLVRETLRELGAEPLCLPIVRDELAALDHALSAALPQADIVLISGGSSKGDEDITATLLHRRGQVLCHGAQAVPGKPLCAAIIDGKPVINMPGPFLAVYHVLEWCVNGIVSHFLTQPPRRRQTVKATITRELRGSDHVSMLIIVELTRKKDGGYLATPCDLRQTRTGQSIRSNAQYMTKLNEYIPAGGEIEVELLRGPENIPEAAE